MAKLGKMAKYGVPPLFSPKNNCVLNDSFCPKMHFGIFFFPYGVDCKAGYIVVAHVILVSVPVHWIWD